MAEDAPLARYAELRGAQQEQIRSLKQAVENLTAICRTQDKTLAELDKELALCEQRQVLTTREAGKTAVKWSAGVATLLTIALEIAQRLLQHG